MKMRIFCKFYFSIIKENIKNLYFTYNDFLKKSEHFDDFRFLYSLTKGKIKKMKN
jgi:hypothetical protein